MALTAACAVGIEKAVLLSDLDLVRDYPEEYLIDPQWNALPTGGSRVAGTAYG